MTYEHMPRDGALAVMRAARDVGIDFLDDARYDDRTGTAPMPTGYSEVLFGELFRDVWWQRDEVVVANKAWLEFWPDQSAAAEVDASLGRMGFEYLDLVYSAPPPDGYALTDLVADLDALVRRGTVRSWGFLNCSPSVLRDACTVARDAGLAMPVAAQLPYSLVARAWVESDEMVAVLDEFGVSVVASATLAGGALTAAMAEVPGLFERVVLVLPPEGHARGRYAPWLESLLAEPAPALTARVLVIARRSDAGHPVRVAEQWATALGGATEILTKSEFAEPARLRGPITGFLNS
jgi:aryl-alcohol dehydrogenase-like predicted oxidoreductase